MHQVPFKGNGKMHGWHALEGDLDFFSWMIWSSSQSLWRSMKPVSGRFLVVLRSLAWSSHLKSVLLFFSRQLSGISENFVSRNRAETDLEKIASLQTWQVPQNLRELGSFWRFAGYYRRFLTVYSNIVKPLHSLTSGYPPQCKRSSETVCTANRCQHQRPWCHSLSRTGGSVPHHSLCKQGTMAIWHIYCI